MSFKNMKSSSSSLTEKLQAQLKNVTSGGRNTDDRFWKPTKDQAGNAYAVIRFLPPAPSKDAEGGVEDVSYVRIYDHGFKGPGGKWYIEKSRSTIGEDDPVGAYNSMLWSQNTESGKKQASLQKRRTKFISNIYIVEDPANPANNGKVFLFSYGKKIFEKINDKMNPKFPGEEKINPYDLWTGANFKLKMTEVENYPNYDKSDFMEAAPLDKDDSKMEAVWNKQYPLLPFLDPSEFKSYDELTKKLNDVLGLQNTSNGTRKVSPKPVENDESEDDRNGDTPSDSETSGNDGDDEIAFFKSLAGNK